MKSLCVSLETAKALKAAGWSKPTAYVWVRWNKSQEYDVSKYAIFVSKDGTSNWDWLPSPTAEEILRELPEKIDLNEWRRDLQFIFISPEKGKWEVSYGQFKKFKNKSLSEAAAQMWLWCVENGYIKTEAKP